MLVVAEVVDNILEAAPVAVLVLAATVQIVPEQVEPAQLILGPVVVVVEIYTVAQEMAVMVEKE